MSDSKPQAASPETGPSDFIREIVAADLASGRRSEIVTRFPPEPNGYLHLGHATAICLSFGIAEEFGGRCHLRFDDTNPTKEKDEYVEGIMEDIRWLGFDWGEHLYFASDYFQQLYDWALQLVRDGKAFVCDLDAEAMREYRGTLTEPGKNSPYRDRSVEENIELFEGMRAGQFPPGSRTLRAKIDMAAPNINLRDPVLYRILDAEHHRTGDSWCIYPSYDWAHGQSDSIEGVTHSLCSLEFEDHRPLYDWFIEQLGIFAPQQIEFARFNLSHSVTSKRKLLPLIEQGIVAGWDDPRMITLAGLRRRGYPPEAIRNFAAGLGMSKRNKNIEMARLEHAVRDHLNYTAERRLAVLRPLRVTITNWPEGKVDLLPAINNPEDPAAGSREIPFSGTLFIERSDFMEDPPRKFFRLAPEREVRLRYGYFITCEEVVKNAEGEVIELRCSYDPETRGGNAPDGRKVRGTIHWVSAAHAVDAEVRLYNPLFRVENPGAGGADLLEQINLESLEVLEDCKLEPSLGTAEPGDRFQFERQGYFVLDPDSGPDPVLGSRRPVFNRIVSLRDSWKKLQRAQGKGRGSGKRKGPRKGNRGQRAGQGDAQGREPGAGRRRARGEGKPPGGA